MSAQKLKIERVQTEVRLAQAELKSAEKAKEDSISRAVDAGRHLCFLY